MSSTAAPASSPLFSLGALGGLTGMDPLSMAVDLGGSILGLPPEVKNIAKVAIGVATANPIMIFNGVQGLAQNAAEAAATEYKPPEYTAVSGYAASGAASASMTSLGGPTTASSRGRCADHSGGQTSGSGSSGHASSGSPTPGGTANAQLPAGGGKLSHEEAAYYQSAAVLAANFTKAETAGLLAIRDGQLTLMDLQRIANDPNANPELVKASLFFLDHPDRFMRMSTSSWTPFGPGVGFVSLEELRREVQKGVERGALVPNQGGSSPGPVGSGITTGGGCVGPVSGGSSSSGGSGPGGVTGGGGTSGTDPLDAILNNPNLSASEKAEHILMQILMDLDGDMLGLLGEMREVRKKQANAGDDKTKNAELASDMELLQHRLQKVMERRTQMMTLLTNMSKLTHEAHMACINNTR